MNTYNTGSAEDNTRVEISAIVDNPEIVDSVSVKLSYGIIDRFSKGLYRSPNKAFEELVTNSYDAGAQNVWVVAPQDFSSANASILVGDDGESMSQADLHQLWLIGESRKRSESPPKGRTEPVGQFGIGKLATYVLANRLTYIVRQNSECYALTMDYSVIHPDKVQLMDGVNLQLDVVKLDTEQAAAAARKALDAAFQSYDALPFINHPEQYPNWTLAVLEDLKPEAHDIKLGVLRWVLRTALPLNEEFHLFLNNQQLASAKANLEPMWTFTCGLDEDSLPTSISYEKATVTIPAGETIPAIRLPKVGLISGTAELFESPLKGGKSDALGRSHGYFVRTRGRLINAEVSDSSAVFGVRVELRHGTLSRFRMEVEVPGLDDHISSSREGVRESPELDELRDYLLAVFNKARTQEIQADEKDTFSLLGRGNRLANPPRSLSQGPLRRLLHRANNGEDSVSETFGFSPDDAEAIRTVLSSPDDQLVETIELEPLSEVERLVKYDPRRRAVVLNGNHPFVTNYSNDKATVETLKLMGLTEFLTEIFMLDADIGPATVSAVSKRRDRFLRDIVRRFPKSAALVAQSIRDARNDERALEDTVGDALELLGFEVLRLGGSSHGPDGIASARLGRRSDTEVASYAFTYDTKSSGTIEEALFDEDGVQDITQRRRQVDKNIRADTARTNILKLHRDDAKGTYNLSVDPAFTLLVAPGFQGSDDPDSQIARVCENDSVTPISTNDLARLVELFPIQGLTPRKLKELFVLHTPAQTKKWVDDLSEAAPTDRPPIDQIIEVILEFGETSEAINLDQLFAYMHTRKWNGTKEELGGMVRGIQALAPQSFSFESGIVALDASPDALFTEMQTTIASFGDPAMSHLYATKTENYKE